MYNTIYATPVKNKVLSNTYALLSANIFFSAIIAWLSIASGFNHKIAGLGMLSLAIFLPAYFGLLFAIHKLRNSPSAIGLTFVLTGLLGATISPMLGFAFSTGQGDAVYLSLAGTATIFFLMSAYGKSTKRDLSGLGKVLFFGILGAFVLSLINIFLIQASMLSLIISFAFMILSSLIISYETQRIVNGGETNYVLATVSLFVALYNIFSSLLHILLAFNGDD